jgi:hypothetical protein
LPFFGLKANHPIAVTLVPLVLFFLGRHPHMPTLISVCFLDFFCCKIILKPKKRVYFLRP